MEKKQRYLQLMAAIEAERENERAFFARMSQERSTSEKVEAGVLLPSLTITRMYYTIGELIEIEIEKPQNTPTYLFNTGKGCTLISEKYDFAYPGNISFENKKTIRFIVKHEGIMQHELSHDRSLSLEITYDDHPYQVKLKTLEKVIASCEPLTQYLKEGLYSNLWPKCTLGNKMNAQPNSKLNKEQNAAITGCANSPAVAIIHGPPGTGKTTTIVGLVAQIKGGKRKILVCAPSNNAVDLLSERLFLANVKVLRIGNITRIGDRISHLSMEEKMRNHPEWKMIKKVKIEAEEARRLASTYKRNFGASERAARKSYYQEARQLRQWARDLEERLQEEILRDAEVVCTTLMGASLSILDGIIFDTVIIDEASQATEPECWIPILAGNKLVMVGDHKQLPPIVKSPKALELGLDVTLLDQLTDRLKDSYLLRCQYRMNDDILSFPNLYFYHEKLYGDESVKDRKLINDHNAVTFIDTSGCGFEEALNYKNFSLKNPGEYFIVREHLLSIREKVLGHSIGIISPYAEQVRHIRQEIAGEEDLRVLDIKVDTIDGFQGQEKEVIYLSLVRSNHQGELGFLNDARRLNVALTRAMKKLVIIGDAGTIGQNPLYLQLIEHIEQKYQYLSAWEYMTF